MSDERQPFKKTIADIPIEDAHGGSGSRRLLLDSTDPISRNLEAMTEGFLPLGKAFDWHTHHLVDEFFIVTQGTGFIEYDGDGYEGEKKIDYKEGDLIYSPANISHRLENTGTVDNKFLFIRVAV